MGRRSEVQQLKREISQHGSVEAILALLGRSVRMGHKKLAVQRCLQAEQMGAQVQGALLAYCTRVAAELPQIELEKIRCRFPTACAGPRFQRTTQRRNNQVGIGCLCRCAESGAHRVADVEGQPFG